MLQGEGGEVSHSFAPSLVTRCLYICPDSRMMIKKEGRLDFLTEKNIPFN